MNRAINRNRGAHIACFQRPFPPGSSDRAHLLSAMNELKAQLPITVPCVVDGLKLHTNIVRDQRMPHDHNTVLAKYHVGDVKTVEAAIRGALHARKSWQNVPFSDRATIFLKAADLIREKYRYKLMAATMLGQGKSIWQAEIDAVTELPDFFRFNVKFAEELYSQQPPKNSDGIWNRIEWRPLEGFVAAVSPFNFTAIGGNLPGAPALMGSLMWTQISRERSLTRASRYLKETSASGNPRTPLSSPTTSSCSSSKKLVCRKV